MLLEFSTAKTSAISDQYLGCKELFRFCLQSEECQAREQMQDTMNRHEEELYQVRREYEMLRLEFEQNLSANEQSGIFFRQVLSILMAFGSCL